MPVEGKRAHRLRWLILGVLLIGTVTGTLGNSLVNVALPSIMDHYSVDVGSGIWAVTIYILLFAVTMPLFGRLGDMYGYKRMYLIGITSLGVSSCLAAFAPSFPLLITLRGIQGFSNGPILPTIMAMVGTIFPPGERGRAMGAWALVNSASHAVGPPLSGFLTQYFGWPSIFLSYVPLCFLAVILIWPLVPDDSKSERQPFDLLGATTLTLATLALMFNLRQGTYLGWTSSASLMLWGLFLGLLAAFFVTERKVQQPFVELRLFSNRSYAAATTIAFVQAFCQFGLLFLIPLFLLEVQGYPAAKTGLILACMPISMAITAPVAGRLADRYGCRLLCLMGMGVVAISGVALSFLQPSTTMGYVVFSLALTGVGMGMVQAPAPATVSLVVPPERLGLALGLFNLLRFLGGTLGPTVFALVLQTLGTGYPYSSFRMDFWLVVGMAGLAILAGLSVPGAQIEEAHRTEG